MAARRVADENRKLRELLAQHGIVDDSIDAYLQSSTTIDSVKAGQYGSTSTPVQVLEQLLQTRKPFCSDGNTGAPMNPGGEAAGSRDSSTSQNTVQPLWEPVHPQRLSTQPTGKTTSSTHPFMTPSSSESRGGSNASLGNASSHSISQLQRLTPVSLPRNPSPASHQARRNHQMFDFESQILLSNTYNTHSSTTQQHLQRQSMPQGSSVYMPATNGSNSKTCEFATDIITTMAGADPSVVRAELGCLPGMDCDVDDNLVFDMMDRYTGQG